MDWLLAALALFNLGSMYTVFVPRGVPRKAIPWVLYGFAVLATELAWVWLPLQMSLAWLLALGGALDSGLGELALLVLLLSWPGFVWSIRLSLLAKEPVENALQAGLGADYRAAVPLGIRGSFRDTVGFPDWCRPFSFKRADVEVIRNIAYGPTGVRQKLDIYRPRVLPPEGCPVLLQIHGGAFMIGDKTHQALPLMYAMASRGWICVSINYRLSPSVGFPVHLEDCKRALCWIRTQGREYGMNPDFVAVTGGSAGGHLAALMGLTANRGELQREFPEIDTTVQACVPCYGLYDVLTRHEQHPNQQMVIDFLRDRVLHQTPEENPALWDLASPVAQIHEDAPPFMIVHGAIDSIIPVGDARIFSQRLRRTSRSPTVFLELRGAEHGFDNMHSARTEYTLDGVHRFLEWTRANPTPPHAVCDGS